MKTLTFNNGTVSVGDVFVSSWGYEQTNCGISRKTPQPVIAFETTRSVFAMLFFTVRGGHNVHGEVFSD